MIDCIKYCAQEVFNELGAGHTEAVYEAALAVEISLYDYDAVTIMRQVPCPINYKGFTVGVGYIDILVNGLIVELKSVAKLTPKDAQQVRKYLTALDLAHGLLINFGNDLEIVEVHNIPQGIISVPFPLSDEEVTALKEAWEKKGNHGETPSSAD